MLPHNEEHVYVCMPRADFLELLCSCLAQFKYKFATSADEIKIACRCVCDNGNGGALNPTS